MSTAPNSFRQYLLAGACALVVGGLTTGASAATTSQASVDVGQASTTSESVIVRAQKRLLKEKDSPSAVTELGKRQIQAAGVGASVATLLRQAPSVYVYQQGLGDNAPVLTVRGLRGLEVATTIDGVPSQDLLAPGAFYLANNIGGVITTSQISGVSLYPGVAYPDKNTFGTIGGTIAYSTKRPTDDFYVDLTGSVGSFGTYKEGFEANSGKLDSPLGTGDNAISMLLNYYNFQTQGFIDGTPNRENEMEFALDKPYNDGLSKAQATVIYNTGNGLIQDEPVPVPYLNKYGRFSNYPTNLDFAKQTNDYLTVILKNDTYVNDYLNLGITAFYIANDNQLQTYGSYSIFTPVGAPNPLGVGGANPFVNNFAGFGYPAYLFGAPNPPPLGLFGGGTGGYFYGNPGNTYDPYKLYPAGSKYCPNSYVALWGGRVNAPCGLNDQITGGHSDTYGIQPRVTITPPTMFGVDNTIKFGALLAKETSPSGYEYVGGGPNTPMTPQNEYGNTEGGTQRTIYQGYVQDKIDLLDNTLHLTPGGTLEGTYSSLQGPLVYNSKASPGYGPNGYFSGGGTDLNRYGPYKGTKWDREALPFFNITYDLDKIAPMLAGLQFYGSIGNSALFAPVGDFGPSTATSPPNASIVHFYEGGIKYSTGNLLLTTDYFYQKVDRDFGYFSYQSGPLNGDAVYSNFGQREFKGVEGSAVYQITPEWQVFGNFSWLRARYLTSGFALDTVAEDQYGFAIRGTPVSGIPDWLSTFGFDYDHKNTFVDADDFNFRFTGQYTGHQYTTTDLSGTAYLNEGLQFPGLLPLTYGGCPGTPPKGANTSGTGCAALTRYNQVTGATVTDTQGGGISPFAVFGFDAAYTLPTPTLPVLKKVTFDVNVQNLFNANFNQYYYTQVSPANCGQFTSGPFYDPVTKKGAAKNNYSCTPEFGDIIPGAPFQVFFTVTARF
jgi:iron complex outermembrane receptor protein